MASKKDALESTDATPADSPTEALPDSTSGHALGDAMRDVADLQRTEWRPRQTAVTARRMRRFEDAIRRNSLKPPAA